MSDDLSDKDKQTLKDVSDIIADSAKELGLKPTFIDSLVVATDDWSFVIKTHALVEAVSCSMLAHGLGKPELEQVFAEDVEMSARIKLLESLTSITKEESRICRRLGELRNDLVHNASKTDFSFDEYLSNPEKRKAFVEIFGAPLSEEVRKAFAQSPRILIWASVVLLSVKSMHKKKHAEQLQAQLLLQQAILKAVSH